MPGSVYSPSPQPKGCLPSLWAPRWHHAGITTGRFILGGPTAAKPIPTSVHSYPFLAKRLRMPLNVEAPRELNDIYISVSLGKSTVLSLVPERIGQRGGGPKWIFRT